MITSRRGSFLFLFLVLFLVVYPFFSAAQEEAASRPIPGVDLVSPLDRELVSDEVMVLVRPSDERDSSLLTISLLVDGDSIGTFSGPDWSIPWDSKTVSDGQHNLEVEYCLDSRCESKSITVDVTNAVDPVIVAAEERANVRGIGSSDRGSDSGEHALPSDDPLREDSQSVGHYFTPSNSAGAFVLLTSDGEPVGRSSGAPVFLPDGLYTAELKVFDWPVEEVRLQTFDLSEDSFGVFGSIDTVRAPFEFSGSHYVPSSSISVRVGVNPQLARFRLPYFEDTSWFWCQLLDSFSGGCISPTLLNVSPPSSLVDVKGSEVVLVRAKSFGRVNPSLGGVVQIVPADVSGNSVMTDSVGNVIDSRNGPIDIRSGVYSLHSDLHFPVAQLDVEGVSIDKNGTLFSLVRYPSSDESFIVSITPHYPFSSGVFTIDASIDDSRTQVCSGWNEVANECSSDWVSSRNHVIEKDIFALRLFPKEPLPDPVVPDLPRSDAELLNDSVDLLKYLYSNRAFFDDPFEGGDSTVLSTLFSNMEVSMDCGSYDEYLSDRTSATIVSPDDNTLSVTDEAGLPLPLDSDSLLPGSASSPLDVPAAENNRTPSFGRDNSWRSPNWENGVTNMGPGEQSPNFLSCGKVSLQHILNEVSDNSPFPNVKNVGDLFPHVKQSMVLTNASDIEQIKVVNVRLWARPSIASTEDKVYDDSPLYDLVRTIGLFPEDLNGTLEERKAAYSPGRVKNEVIEFYSRNRTLIGSYDYSDYYLADLSPVSLVHSRNSAPVIDTLLKVRVPARGSVVIDPIYALSGLPSFDSAWIGGLTNDQIGDTLDSNAGILLVNVDNNVVANDLIIVAPFADVNGKTNNGGIYLIKDINTTSGLYGLTNPANYSAAWGGGKSRDMLGRTSFPFFGPTGGGSGPGVQVLDLDNNGYANDLIISSVVTDANWGKSNNGAVYIIKDIDKKSGYFDLNFVVNSDVRFTGSATNYYLGFTALGGAGVQVFNIDGEKSANDLVITDSNTGFTGQRVGSVYIIMDANARTGDLDLNNLSNFSYRWDGNFTVGDMLGSCQNSGDCTQVVDVDRNGFPNDLLITDSNYDSRTITLDSGKIYLIKDVNNLSTGIRSLAQTTAYTAAWTTGQNGGMAGSTQGWGTGTQLFDLNGDGFRNDLIITANMVDMNTSPAKTDNGAIFIVYDINSVSGDFNLTTTTNNPARVIFNGGATTDRLGSDTVFNQFGGYMPPKVRLFNMDGNKVANDLIIAAPLADTNALTNNGAIYVIKDINTLSGRIDLNQQVVGRVAFYGAAASDFLGTVNSQYSGFDLINVDGNLGSNDLIITSFMADINGKTDAGVVYFIRDINRFFATAQHRGLNTFDTISSRYNGGASDFLGDTNFSGPPVIVANTDGNTYADDILIVAPRTDLNFYPNPQYIADGGAIYLIRDLRTHDGNFDFNSMKINYTFRWSGDKNFTQLGDTNRSGAGVLITNVNGGAGNSDDIFMMASRLDNHKRDVGGLFYQQDIGALTDTNFQLDKNTNYTSLWRGDNNADGIGDNNTSNISFLVVNTDGNAVANDVLILSARKDMNNTVDNGAVFYIKDITNAKTPYGALTFRLDSPSIDGNSYVLGMEIFINYHIECAIAGCGDVDANIQYCIGINCVDFRDINTVNTSPLYVFSGSNTVSTTNLTLGSGFDANYVLKSADVNVFSIRVLAAGTTALPSTPPQPYTTIVSEATNSKDLLQGYNWDLRLTGGRNSDYLGFTRQSAAGIKFVNIDNGVYANDLLVSAPQADVNGKTNNGAVYLFKNIDLNSGPLDVNANYASFSAMWDGNANNDFIGDTNRNGPGVQLVNIDGNSYTNDLIISSPFVDTNGKTDGGAVYIIRDIDMWDGNFDLGRVPNFAVMFNGGISNEALGHAAHTNNSVQVHNIDGNASANDLFIAAAFADTNAIRDPGRIYMIKDINTLSGVKDFNLPTNFTFALNGGAVNDRLGSGNTDTSLVQAASFQIKNTDNNLFANDLIIAVPIADANGDLDSGIVYLIRDVNTITGARDLNLLGKNYSVAWTGTNVRDRLGFTLGSDSAVQLMDLDGNGYANDMLISAPHFDLNSHKGDHGAIFLIKDIDKNVGRQDLNILTNISALWSGNTSSDLLGDSNQSGLAVQLVNMDGNLTANDLILSIPLQDFNGRTNVGAVYLIKDINKQANVWNDLNFVSSYNAMWFGGSANDLVGDIEYTPWFIVPDRYNEGTIVTSIDGSPVLNDLVIFAPAADTNSLTDNGAIYFIKDINSVTNKQNVLSDSTKVSFALYGGRSGNRLGDDNRSGVGYIIGNVDNNSYSNDLVIAVPFADINFVENNSAVYVVNDLDSKTGFRSLLSPINYNIRYSGQDFNNYLGDTVGSGSGVQLNDMDGQGYANDLIIQASAMSVSGKYKNGVIYIDQNIDEKYGDYSLGNYSNFKYRLVGGRTNNYLGATAFSHDGVYVVNVDGGSVADDLIVQSIAADSNGKSNNGAVYLLKNIFEVAAIDYSFVVSLPSSGCTTGKGNISGGSTCQKGFIESTDVNGVSDANQIEPEGQTSTLSFFVFDNQSSSASDFNIILDLNAALPSSLVLKAGTSSSGYEGACLGVPNGCVLLPTAPSSVSVGKATYSSGTQDLNVFFWGDFIAAAVGDVDRNVDYNSTSP